MLMAMPSARSDRRPRGHAALPDWYRSLLAEHEASGLSLAEFAEVAAISATSLSRWRRRLAQDGGASSTSTSDDQRPVLAGAAPEARRHRLVEVRVAEGRTPSSPQRSSQAFIVQLAKQRRIEVVAGFDAAELGRLVEVLETC